MSVVSYRAVLCLLVGDASMRSELLQGDNVTDQRGSPPPPPPRPCPSSSLSLQRTLSFCPISEKHAENHSMVGTIRRPLPEPASGAGGQDGTGTPPPPPSYVAATTIPAGTFRTQHQQQQQRPQSYAPQQSSDRPLSSAPAPGRPQSLAPSTSSGFQQPPGPPPKRTPSMASQSSQSSYQTAPRPMSVGGPPPGTPVAGSAMQRSNTSEDKLAVLRRYDVRFRLAYSHSRRTL